METGQERDTAFKIISYNILGKQCIFLFYAIEIEQFCVHFLVVCAIPKDQFQLKEHMTFFCPRRRLI